MKRLIQNLLVLIIGLYSQEAWSCRCAPTVWDQLSKDPTQAGIITLLKVPKSIEPESGPPKKPEAFTPRQLKLELKPYKRGAPQVWNETGSSCDLRWNEDVWYVLVSQSTAEHQPMLCNSWVRPVEEATELLAKLEKAWDKSQTQANPHWSVGCKKHSDCVVDESRGCLPSTAILPRHRAAITKWRKEQEPRLNCESAPGPGAVSGASAAGKSSPAKSAKPPSLSARCHTGVCELEYR
ncbi:MAG TPA: hypothetical protein PLZ57_08765 [Pseudobdellovibrionaceae bacterium]|nr:hypothetical protein [Pseudobdellovibrionaceae bacterium]